MRLKKIAKIQSLIDEIQALKKELAEAIRNLPLNNPNIKPLGMNGRCFTIMLSEMVKHDNWTAGYHCFTQQYEALAEFVERCSSENYVKRLVRTLNSERVEAYMGTKSLHRYVLHPQAIANVKTLLAGKPHVFTMVRKNRDIQTFVGAVK